MNYYSLIQFMVSEHLRMVCGAQVCDRGRLNYLFIIFYHCFRMCCTQLLVSGIKPATV